MQHLRRDDATFLPLTAGLLLLALTSGCADRARAPAVVPAPAPLTEAGQRFDVVVPRNTPVTIAGVRQDPEDETFRAFRYDWVADGRPPQSGQREAGDAAVELPAVPERGFLYVDAVHRPPGGATAQKSGLAQRLFKKQRIGSGIWRLHFVDGRGVGRADDLVVTVRFRPQEAAAARVAAPAQTRSAGGAAAVGRQGARAAPGSAGNTPTAPPTWGARELGRPVAANPCAGCGLTDKLSYRASPERGLYWIRCERCGRSVVAQRSAAQAEQSWNEENPGAPTTGNSGGGADGGGGGAPPR